VVAAWARDSFTKVINYGILYIVNEKIGNGNELRFTLRKDNIMNTFVLYRPYGTFDITPVIAPFDEGNSDGARKNRNTDAMYFNCGGFALGTYTWYLPITQWAYDNELFDRWENLRYCIGVMLAEFKGRLRKIEELSELRENEYAIAFRLSSDGDFHYRKRVKDNLWAEKNGYDVGIRLHEGDDEVLNDCEMWNGRYDGEIVLFAMKRNAA
jgi:hypothetical protein